MINRFNTLWILLGVCLQPVLAQEARIEIQADKILHPVSRYLTGACIEDVNHEIYGGIYSQMIFGESFQEPPISRIHGYNVLGGTWRIRGEELHYRGNLGDKLVSELPPFSDGEVGVEVHVPDRKMVNSGLIVRVKGAGPGMDNFDGYEISLNAAEQHVLLGRHRHNWEPIKTISCTIPTGGFVPLVVKLSGKAIEILVNGKSITTFEEDSRTLPAGTIGLRAFQAESRWRNLWVKTSGETKKLTFSSSSDRSSLVSGMWRPVQIGTAKGEFQQEDRRPFVGKVSQTIQFVEGQGRIGVENQGLNRWKMHFEGGKPYEGLLWARTEKPTTVVVSLESHDGSKSLAEETLLLDAGDWKRLAFILTPLATEKAGRFTIALTQPGKVNLGYAFLQPGPWGRYQGLPVRRDVVEGLIDQGITVLRYGGSMINHAEYRWKKMIGPRERRQPNPGTWYAHSINGWGIIDFIDLCEVSGFLSIPAFNMDETPQDMADFVEYVNGPADSEWGKRRVADGHSKPYHLKYIELGNEERVDEGYYAKFKKLAEAIWAKDPTVILVVGDFAYGEAITDPFQFRGAASGITSLAAHQKILQLARQNNREVWFDLHIDTEGPIPHFGGTLSFRDAIEKLAKGTTTGVMIFEFNSNNHSHRRALANAAAINRIERDGKIPIATSANCLQPDQQNDNDWNQGLLFLNPSRVWLQPPGYVTQIYSREYQPMLVESKQIGQAQKLDLTVKRSKDEKTVVLQVVNPTADTIASTIQLAGFIPQKETATVTELAGPPNAVNTAIDTRTIVPVKRSWKHAIQDGKTRYSFPPSSITVLRLE